MYAKTARSSTWRCGPASSSMRASPTCWPCLRDVTERVQSFQLLEQRVRERTRELSALLAFSRQASATLEVRPLMELVVEEVSRLVDSTGVSLLMLEGETLKMAAHRGPLPASTAEQVRLAVNDPGLRNHAAEQPDADRAF